MAPELTPSERGYLFNKEAFLKGIKERGDRLFEDGYRVFATGEPGILVMTVPCRESEKHYFVNAAKQICSCPFHRKQREGFLLTEDGSLIPCKHLEGLETLVKKTIQMLRQSGDLSYFKLRASWISVVAGRRGNLLSPQATYTPEAAPEALHSQERKSHYDYDPA